MRVTVTSQDEQRAREVHRLFSAKLHSEHIASEFALAHLAAVLRANEVRTVLEFGAGIGTMTYLLLSTLPELAVECTEKNELCFRALEDNLPAAMRARLHIHTERYPVIKGGPFDLVIIDGRVAPGPNLLKAGSICFAEGDRESGRSTIEAALAERGLTCMFTNYENPRLIWRASRFGVPRPSIARKGCWIGRVETR